MKLFLFSERTMLYSHVAVQIFSSSISAWAVRCSISLMFLVSKIYPACSFEWYRKLASGVNKFLFLEHDGVKIYSV